MRYRHGNPSMINQKQGPRTGNEGMMAKVGAFHEKHDYAHMLSDAVNNNYVRDGYTWGAVEDKHPANNHHTNTNMGQGMPK